jgi:polyisoprenyl-phosphate glycosyltransferase
VRLLAISDHDSIVVPNPSIARPRYSVVVPVYGNEPTLVALLGELGELATGLDGPLEVVFVVDGSPDGSLILLRRLLSEGEPFSAQVITLSRNFGSFSAIRVGLAAAEGDLVAVKAADLQEPPSLLVDFFAQLADGFDVVVGVRAGRSDGLVSGLMSSAFWALFRRFGHADMPRGGVDVFGCTQEVAGHLIRMEESHTSLVGLVHWVGFRRAQASYVRQPRPVGRTAWRFWAKARYLLDSIFSFTDIPIIAIAVLGVVGVVVSLGVAAAVLIVWLTSGITVAGYAPIMLSIVFTASSVLLSLGVIGSYVWRTYENTKHRPNAIPMHHERFPVAEAQSSPTSMSGSTPSG